MSERPGFSYTLNSCYEGVDMIAETRFSEATGDRPPAYLTAVFARHDVDPGSDKYKIIEVTPTVDPYNADVLFFTY